MGRARLARVCDLSSIGLAIAAALLVISFGRFLSLASDAAYDHIEVQQRTEHQAIGRRWEPSSTAHPIRQRLTLATSQDVSCEPQTIPLVGSIQLLPDIHCGMAPQPLCVPLAKDACSEVCHLQQHGIAYLRHDGPQDGCALPPREPYASHPARRILRNALRCLVAQQQGVAGWQDWSLPAGDLPTRAALPADLHLRGDVLLYGGADSVQSQLLARHVVDGSIVSYVSEQASGGPLPPPPAPSAAVVVGDSIRMLPFPSGAFDTVLSLHTLQYAANVELHLQEAARVLKAGGLLYLNWHPMWSSARGHAVTAERVAAWERSLNCTSTGFRNDGTFIHDWSHLLAATEFDFQQQLLKTSVTVCAGLVEAISGFVFHSLQLNRVYYSEVLGHVRQLRELQLVQSASLPADAGVAPLDAATAARLQVLHPKETHFGLSEAVLVLRKVGRSMTVQ